MKQELEKRILDKENQIKKYNLDLEYYKNKLKSLTFNEYGVEDYVITIAAEMKKAKDEITRLQFEVYELMQILKAE